MSMSNQEIRNLVTKEYETAVDDGASSSEELRKLREIIQEINIGRFDIETYLGGNRHDDIANSFKVLEQPDRVKRGKAKYKR